MSEQIPDYVRGHWPQPDYDPEYDTGFPIAEPSPPPVMISRPCGCTFMDIREGGSPAQISWCVAHDPGYTPYAPHIPS